PYSNKLTELLQSLSASSEGESSEFAQEREVQNVLVVAISSNRGLAGAFNSNIIKGVKHLSENQLSGKNIDLLLIGKKAGDVLSKTMNVVESNNEIFDDLTFNNVANMAEKMMEDFIAEKYDQILFVYNKFINAATQEVMTEQFLPILPKKEEQEEIQGNNEVDYIFEPEKDQIINELIPKTLKIQLFKAI